MNKAEIIKLTADEIKAAMLDWFYKTTTTTADLLVEAMARQIDFNGIAAIVYEEAAKAKKTLDVQREKATAEYEDMVFDDSDQILAVIKIAKDCKGDVDKVVKTLEAEEYNRLLDVRGIKHEYDSEAGEALRDARLINYRPTAEMACEKYQKHDEDEDETAVKEEETA